MLQAVQRLVDNRDSPEDDEERSESDVVLSLVGVRPGSAAYPVESHRVLPDVPAPIPHSVVQLISSTGSALDAPADSSWSHAQLSSVEELSRTAARLDCQIEFRTPGKDGQRWGDVIAKIEPMSYQRVEGSAFVRGETSVYARIERVGGATGPRCGIRLHRPGSRMLFCSVASDSLLKELGQYIFQSVVLHGSAVWLRHGFTLKTMAINSYEPPKTGSVFKALETVRASGGDAWDKIDDPDSYMAQLRT